MNQRADSTNFKRHKVPDPQYLNFINPYAADLVSNFSSDNSKYS